MKSLELLARLVSIKSTYPNEQKISQYVEKFLIKLGFKIQIVTTGKNRNNVIATYGKAMRYLAFYAHFDTVPLSPGYNTDPYSLTIKGDRAYGLGAGDVKGGLTAILQTATYAVKNKLPMKLVITVDEENISQGAHDVIDSGALSDVKCIISSESGQIKDTSLSYCVVYGRLGRALFDITVTGLTAHAAEAQKGVHAVMEAIRLIEEIKKIKLPKDKKLGLPQLVLQAIHAETKALSVPDSCVMQYSLLSNPCYTTQHFLQDLKNISRRLHVTCEAKLHTRATPYGDSYTLNATLPCLTMFEKSIFTPDGVTPTYAQSIGDENIFANRLKIPVLVVGPIRDNAHRANEWISVKSLFKIEKVYQQLLQIHHNLNKV